MNSHSLIPSPESKLGIRYSKSPVSLLQNLSTQKKELAACIYLLQKGMNKRRRGVNFLLITIMMGASFNIIGYLLDFIDYKKAVDQDLLASLNLQLTDLQQQFQNVTQGLRKSEAILHWFGSEHQEINKKWVMVWQCDLAEKTEFISRRCLQYIDESENNNCLLKYLKPLQSCEIYQPCLPELLSVVCSFVKNWQLNKLDFDGLQIRYDALADQIKSISAQIKPLTLNFIEFIGSPAFLFLWLWFFLGELTPGTMLILYLYDCCLDFKTIERCLPSPFFNLTSAEENLLTSSANKYALENADISSYRRMMRGFNKKLIKTEEKLQAYEARYAFCLASKNDSKGTPARMLFDNDLNLVKEIFDFADMVVPYKAVTHAFGIPICTQPKKGRPHFLVSFFKRLKEKDSYDENEVLQTINDFAGIRVNKLRL